MRDTTSKTATWLSFSSVVESATWINTARPWNSVYFSRNASNASSFCLTPCTSSSLSRPTISFIPAYRSLRTSTHSWTSGSRLEVYESNNQKELGCEPFIGEINHVDANGEYSDFTQRALEVDSARQGLQRQYAGYRLLGHSLAQHKPQDPTLSPGNGAHSCVSGSRQHPPRAYHATSSHDLANPHQSLDSNYELKLTRKTPENLRRRKSNMQEEADCS